MLNFIGIGAQKAGTSWLYHMLSHHPQILFPAGKEIHFWDQQTHRGIQWYRDLFSGALPPEIRQGEITPAYAFLSLESISDIKRLFPDLRLIYMIRNPIERAWSSARMALERAEMTLTEASDAWFIDHFRSQGSLRRGDYETCIRQWRAIFGSEVLLILRYEDISDSPRTLLRDCLVHIGVDSGWAATQPQDLVSRRVFSSERALIRPNLLLVLQEIYQPKISSLARYLNMDLSDWQK
jgi:hypothetical protein